MAHSAFNRIVQSGKNRDIPQQEYTGVFEQLKIIVSLKLVFQDTTLGNFNVFHWSFIESLYSFHFRKRFGSLYDLSRNIK